MRDSLYTDDERAMIQEIRRLRAVIREQAEEIGRLQADALMMKTELDYRRKLLNGKRCTITLIMSQRRREADAERGPTSHPRGPDVA